MGELDENAAGWEEGDGAITISATKGWGRHGAGSPLVCLCTWLYWRPVGGEQAC